MGLSETGVTTVCVFGEPDPCVAPILGTGGPIPPEQSPLPAAVGCEEGQQGTFSTSLATSLYEGPDPPKMASVCAPGGSRDVPGGSLYVGACSTAWGAQQG